MLALMSTVAISSSGSESSVSVSIRCGLPFSSSVNDSFFSPRTKRPCASVTITGTCTAATSTVSLTSRPLRAPVRDEAPAVGQRRDRAQVVLAHLAARVPGARPRRPLQRAQLAAVDGHHELDAGEIGRRQRDGDRDLADAARRLPPARGS